MTEQSAPASLSTDPCVDPKLTKNLSSMDVQSIKAVLAVALYIIVARAKCIVKTQAEAGDDGIESLKTQLASDLNTISPIAGGSADISDLVDYVADPDNQLVITELAALISRSKMIPEWGGHQHPTLSELQVALF